MRTNTLLRLSMLSVLAFAIAPAAACSSATPSEPSLDDPEAAEGAEVWDTANNPAYVDSTFVYEIGAFPLEGKSKVAPTPGDYWGTYKDGVNYRWNGTEPSPAEKLEAALNKPGLALEISKTSGIRAHTSRKACKLDSECTDLKDGSKCAIPRGEESGRCIPTWWGICHGWAPYAFSEPAPLKAVTVNGVTFQPGDLEGLMSLTYTGRLPTKFISQRCNKDFDRADAGTSGRVTEGECRDMNPGSMMVVVGNMLGIRQQSLVEDRTFDDEVWNQPLESYSITNGENGKLKEITKAQALALLGNDMQYKELVARTTLKKEETKKGTYTAEADGDIVVRTSGNSDVDLFVNIGAEASAAAKVCYGGGGDSNEVCRVAVKKGDVVHFTVLGYADTSDFNLEVGTALANPVYSYNTTAEQFYHVKMDLRYITESHPAPYSHQTPDRVSEYIRTDSYEFILEVKGGKIVGGEWVGASMRKHPDFMWWPTAKPTSTLPMGVTYADVKKIHDQASTTTPTTTSTPPVAGTETVLLNNQSLSYGSKYVTLGVKGGDKVRIELSGTGEVDLYARLGRKPTIYTNDASSAKPGPNEVIEFTAPSAGGSYWIRVRNTAYTGSATVTLKATVTPG